MVESPIVVEVGVDVASKNTLSGKSDDAPRDKQDTETYPWREVIEYLNAKAGKGYLTKPGVSHKGPIVLLFKAGYFLDDFKAVIKDRVNKWGRDEKMVDNLRPSTLFRKSNFENYHGGLGTGLVVVKAERRCRACGKETTFILDGKCDDCYEAES
jgi:uncharacterized phage protein (TIGR02220 family)